MMSSVKVCERAGLICSHLNEWDQQTADIEVYPLENQHMPDTNIRETHCLRDMSSLHIVNCNAVQWCSHGPLMVACIKLEGIREEFDMSAFRT